MISIAKLVVKFAIAFSISFVILSVPIGRDTIFEKISEYVQPFDDDFIDKTKEAVKVGIEATKDIKEQFIKNTAPSVYQKKQVVHVKGNALSEDVKNEEGPSKKDRPETYNDSEKRQLDTIFN